MSEQGMDQDKLKITVGYKDSIEQPISPEHLSDQPILKVRISPQNRWVDTTSVEWIEKMELERNRLRDFFKDTVKEKIATGKMELKVDKKHKNAKTADEGIYDFADAMAISAVSEWTILRGVGVATAQETLYHGTKIEYIDDPSIASLDYAIVEGERPPIMIKNEFGQMSWDE